MKEIGKNGMLKLGKAEHTIENLSDVAKSHIAHIQFIDSQIAQLQNELAISNTARAGYLRLLTAELKRDGKVGA